MPDINATTPCRSTGIIVCTPLYNDWRCAAELLTSLDTACRSLGQPVQVVLVDDGSTEPVPAALSQHYAVLHRITLLRLRRNVGHQRAIALGLAFIYEEFPSESVVVMDGDGEDSPSDIRVLAERCTESQFSKIVFAKRQNRTEGLLFKSGYIAFKILHRLLTGRAVEVGNFSFIPHTMLPRVVCISELWNHYAAGVFHAKLPIDTVPLDRARRFTGASKMNFPALVAHGMSAISVFGDIVGARLLALTIALMGLTLIGLAVVAVVRLVTSFAVPGWATTAFGLLCVILLNMTMLATAFALLVLNSRNVASFIPMRDWKVFVLSHMTLYEHKS